MDLCKQMSSSKRSFNTCICGIVLPLNPSTTTVYAQSVYFTPACILLSVCSRHFTRSLHFTPGPQSAVRSLRFTLTAFFSGIFLSKVYKTLKPLCSKVNNKATMMYFIGSFEYRVTFLVKIRRFNGHWKWKFCILGQWFLGKFSGRSSL